MLRRLVSVFNAWAARPSGPSRRTSRPRSTDESCIGLDLGGWRIGVVGLVLILVFVAVRLPALIPLSGVQLSSRSGAGSALRKLAPAAPGGIWIRAYKGVAILPDDARPGPSTPTSTPSGIMRSVIGAGIMRRAARRAAAGAEQPRQFLRDRGEKREGKKVRAAGSVRTGLGGAAPAA